MALPHPSRRRRRRRLFVTGGSGFLGRHVVNHPDAERWEVIAPSSRAIDLRSAGGVRSMIHDWKPSAVIHTAYRRDDPASVIDITRNVAEATVHVGARLVHVSTDALFGGRPQPYDEEDEPDPVHDYGRWKAIAERDVARIDPTAVSVRTSLLFGSSELSPHELAVRDVVSGHADMTFFTDEIRSPALVGDLAAALIALADRTTMAGVLHLGGPDALSRADLAVLTARRHGWDESRLRFSSIEESGLSRPACIILDSGLAAANGLWVRGPAE